MKRDDKALLLMKNAAKRLVKVIDLKAPDEIIEGEVILINKFMKIWQEGE